MIAILTVWGNISLLFWIAFLWLSAMLSIFSCACCPTVISSLEKCLFCSCAHFLIKGLLKIYWVVWAVYIFWISQRVFGQLIFFFKEYFDDSNFFYIAALFIFYFLDCVGSSVRARAFSSCGKWGPLFIAVRGPFTIVAPPVAGHRLQTRRLSSCGSRA